MKALKRKLWALATWVEHDSRVEPEDVVLRTFTRKRDAVGEACHAYRLACEDEREEWDLSELACLGDELAESGDHDRWAAMEIGLDVEVSTVFVAKMSRITVA